MSANIGKIVAEITANTAGLRRGAAEAQRIMKNTSNGASVAGKSIYIAFAVTAALGVAKLIDKLEDCTQVAIDNKKALMGLESVAKAYGVSVEDATKITKEFTRDGLIQMKNASTGMKNILSTGFNITEAMNLSQALKDIGAFNNVVVGGLGVAFEDVTKGMRTGSIELIENIGLTQRLSAVMKAAHIDISNGIDLTNNAAQREAFYNMVLKEGEKFKGNAAKLANDQASAQVKANAAMKEAADAIGNRLLPAYSGIMKAITDLAVATTDIFKISKFEAVTNELNSQEKSLKTLQYTYLELKGKINLTDAEQKMFLRTIQELKTTYPDFLGNIDMQNIKLSSAITLFEELNKQMLNKRVNMMQEAEMSDLMDEQIKLRIKEAEAMEKVNTLKANPVGGWRGKYTAINLTNLAHAEDLLLNIRRKMEANGTAIDRTNEKYKKLKENIASSEKTTIYTKPAFLTKLEADTKESQRIQAEIDKRNQDKNVISGTAKKESYSLDTTESTKQKLIEQEYKYKTDLANAKEEEKWRVELENKKAVAVIKAVAENKKKIAKIREKVENGRLSESAGKKQAQALNEQLAKQLGKLELDLTVKEKGVDYAKNALGLSSLESYGIIVPIAGDITQLEKELQRIADNKMKEVNKQSGAVGLMDMSNYGVTARTREDDIADENRVKSEYVNKTLEDVTKSFADLASVLDNDVLNALSNVANQAMSMKGSISGFSAAQGANDKLGMLSSGLGMFSSAVGIFSAVGGLFSKSTYNFDEAVKKMLAGIGEKTPELQVAEYQKGIKLRTDTEALNLTNDRAGYDKLSAYLSSINMSFVEYYETLATIDKIIPQLADQLGTAAGDFGSSIGSALSSATTSEELKANLYDSIYGTVKSGLINAFLAGEIMKPLLNRLQQTVTIAVADGALDATEKTAIQGILGNVNTEAGKFYTALEEVGLNVVDAAGQLNQAADRMDNVNRNLRLADRISTITTQTSTAGITQLAGNSSIVYDFSNANLGGMTEQQVISAVSKANRMASIRKVGV